MMENEEMDIYFTEEYGKVYEANGEGKLERFKLESKNGKVIYYFLKRELPVDLGKKYYDIVTPYGYGGPLFVDYSDEYELNLLKKEYEEKFTKYCLENNIVSEFIKFHPILENQKFVKEFMEVIYSSEYICLDVTSENEILENMTSDRRNKIRKAIKNNIEIKILENNPENIEKFYEMYVETMDKNRAAEYYYFSKEFFLNNLKFLKENLKIFAAYEAENMISISLVIFKKECVHYYFSANDPEALYLSGNSLLIYEAIKWAADNKKKYFHLGGGLPTLYRFKKSFTKKEPYKLYIGRKIYNHEIYRRAVEETEKIKTIENKEFFPKYRG